MKHSAKANAITNSPFVRALIQPVLRQIRPPAPLPPPSHADLIPTQPVQEVGPGPQAGPSKAEVVEGSLRGVGVVGGVGETTLKAAGKKRAREEDHLEEEGDVDEVVVRYTKDNLPPELNKCKLNNLSSYSLPRAS